MIAFTAYTVSLLTMLSWAFAVWTLTDRHGLPEALPRLKRVTRIAIAIVFCTWAGAFSFFITGGFTP